MVCKDEIIAEVWRNRDAYAKRHGRDLCKIVADLEKKQPDPFSPLVDRRRQTIAPSGKK